MKMNGRMAPAADMGEVEDEFQPVYLQLLEAKPKVSGSVT